MIPEPWEGRTPTIDTNQTESGSTVSETTTSLGKIRGTDSGGIERYWGIRFAEPPVGERRFAPTVRSGGWDGTYDATAYANRAIQPPMAEIFGPPGPGLPDEDCLFLNVFTPAADDAARPVMVWVHGGSYTTGSGNDYDASVLARQGDVVVVTVNYRLGVFGFLDLSSLGEQFAGSASNGFRDQIAALEWVHDHIADFGGDPSNVTIFGESAGAGSVLALLASPSAEGLFHKVIAHSPGGVNTAPVDFLSPLTAKLDDRGDGSVIDRLRALTAEKLLELQLAVAFNGGDIDGVVVTRHPTVAAGERGIPLIVGSNADEGTLFSSALAAMPEVFKLVSRMVAGQVVRGADPAALLQALRDAYPQDSDVQIYEKVWVDLFRRAAVETAAAATDSGAGGWLYRFDVPTSIVGGKLGATHACEIAFTFNWFDAGGAGLVMHERSEENIQLARRWSATVAAFARAGDPNGAGLPDWPQYSSDDRRCLILDSECRVETDPDAEHRKIWDDAS